jgi:hypothetical protein
MSMPIPIPPKHYRRGKDGPPPSIIYREFEVTYAPQLDMVDKWWKDVEFEQRKVRIRVKKGPASRKTTIVDSKTLKELRGVRWQRKKPFRPAELITLLEKKLNGGLLAEEAEATYARLGYHTKPIYIVDKFLKPS